MNETTTNETTTNETTTSSPTPQTMTSIDQLHALVRAAAEVVNQLELLDSCRFGSAEIVEAAVADVHDSLHQLDQLGPRAGMPPLRALHDPRARGGDADLANALAAKVRLNLDRIREASSSLSLELRRLLADTRDVVSMATGSAGTYDASGRTTAGQVRRTRGLV